MEAGTAHGSKLFLRRGPYNPAAMPAHRHPLQHARALVARRPMLLWWFLALLLLKAAVPLIAASAAHHRGVNLADVCSVFGVRTVSIEHEQQRAPQPQAEHAGDEHCGLAPALGAVLLGDVPKAAVVLHAPAA